MTPTSAEKLHARGKAVEVALHNAYRKAVIQHKQGGVPMVFWENGKVIHVQPDDLEVPELLPLTPVPLDESD